MHSKTKIAVIGAGNMGRHHVRNYFEIEECELVAISDPNPTSKELANSYSAKYFADYKEMFDTCEIDALSLVVPTPLHFPIAREAMSRGINVLIEKPIASTQEEAKELISIANANDLVLTVGHIERYNPVIGALKELVDSEVLGDISSIISKRLGGFPSNEPKTDVVMDLAIHDIDLISYLTGQDCQVVGVHGSRTFHSKEIDSAEVLLRYGNCSGFIQANWVTPVKIRRISITGSKGFVEADYITQEVVHYDANVSPGLDSFQKFVEQFSNPQKIGIQIEKKEPLKQELLAFISAVSGDRSKLLLSPEEALGALTTADLVSTKLKDLEVTVNG